MLTETIQLGQAHLPELSHNRRCDKEHGAASKN